MGMGMGTGMGPLAKLPPLCCQKATCYHTCLGGTHRREELTTQGHQQRETKETRVVESKYTDVMANSGHFYPFLPTSAHLLLPIHVYPHLPMSTHVYPCLPMSTHVYPCLPMSTHVYPLLPTYL